MPKSKFNFNEYNDYCVMHCASRDEASAFLKHLDSLGKKWCSGGSYLDDDEYRSYGENTCYRFAVGEYGNLRYFRGEGYTILEFEDFEWDEYKDIEVPEDEVECINNYLAEFCV